MAPRIGLNLLYLAPQATGGMETYARALVPELVRAWPEAEFVAFVGSELAVEMRKRPWAETLRVVELPVSSRTRIRRSAAEQTLLAGAVLRARVDLLHSLGTTTPLAPGPAAVVTIHDLIYMRFPATHTGILARGMATLVPLAARRARRIVAVSSATRSDLIALLGVPGEKVDVVHSGPGLPLASTPTTETQLRRRLSLPPGPLVVSPSARRPHKNLSRLVAAVGRLTVPATLVVPGYASGFEADLVRDARSQGAADRLHLCGWLDDADMEGLYRAASCIVFPSLAEGFGLPVLEAMQRGVPVACSNASALAEVGADAALQFDPYRIADMAAAIERLLTDRELRERLITRGRRRAAEFSWERAGRETVASYRRALGWSSRANSRSSGESCSTAT